MKRHRTVFAILAIMALSAVFAGHANAGPIRDKIIKHMAQKGAETQRQNALSMGEKLLTLDHDGLTRSYLLFVPDTYDSSKPAPLLIVMHGGGGAADGMTKMAGDLNDYAAENGVIVAYPNGTGPFQYRLLTWNAGGCCGQALDNNVDDVGFIRDLIGALRGAYNIDASRIYATGMSNGAMMAYRLGCELSDVLAGIAPVSGALDIDCHPKQPLSVVAFHGTADQHVLYDGGVAPKQADRKHPNRKDQSVSYAISFWTGRDNCADGPLHKAMGDVVGERYNQCANGTEVVLYTVKGGGHDWPGGVAYAGGDEPTKDISASHEIIDFMLSHPKGGR
ncbi:MAG TPA: PHB depolymerase family esterase [Patescibacteria group bacterium]|nr:PHB depolymerase family esterase [Patescibacteria group bacterium]